MPRLLFAKRTWGVSPVKVKLARQPERSCFCREVQTEVYNLIKDWSLEEHSYLREHVPKTGLQTPFRDGTLQDVALKVRISWQALILAGFLERVWST